MQTDFLPIENGSAVARDRVPHLSFEDFRAKALDLADQGAKVVHFFAYAEGDTIKLLAVLRTDRLYMAGCDAPQRYTALSAQSEPFHMFEREIAILVMAHWIYTTPPTLSMILVSNTAIVSFMICGKQDY